MNFEKKMSHQEEQTTSSGVVFRIEKQKMVQVESPLDSSIMNIISMQLRMEGQNVEELSTKRGKLLVIALDRSGSMSGSAISEAKLALESLLTNIDGHNERVLFIPYDTSAELIDMSRMSLTEKLNQVQRVHAGGGTDFACVFDAIRLYTGALDGQIAIVFFTDGQDGYNGNRETAIDMMKKRLTTESESFEFHTIGFSSGHDARLLTDMTRLGSAQGTFQYAESASSISTCVNCLTELVKGSSLTCNLIVKDKEGIEILKERINLENDDGLITFQSFINIELAPESQIYLEFENTTVPVSLEAFERSEPSSIEKLSLQIKSIERFLIEAAGTISSETTSLEEIHTKGKTIEEKLESITSDIRKNRDRSVRRALFQLIEPIFDSLANFNKVLAESMVGTLSNEKIANLNSLAYRSITKRSLQKKLDQRAQNNVELFEKAEEIIKNSVDTMNFEEIKGKYSKQADEIGPCFYTCCNWIDLLQDKDCLCLGLQVNRPQTAIADSSKVQISSVSTSLMSAESFLDSVTFSIGSAYNVESSHGGFKDVRVNEQHNPNEAKIISGASRESINAVLPLFISEEHWKVSRQKMKPILGFIATLDIMGYAFEQFKTIPFLVLNKLLQESSESELTEFQSMRLNLVMDTCLQIVKECSSEHMQEKMSETLLKLLTDYNTKPETRTVDVIPNNEVFLAQLICAQKLGYVDVNSVDMGLFFKNIAEEELRRKGGFSLNLDEVTVDLWFSLLGIDTNKMITEFVEIKKEKYREMINNSSSQETHYGETIRSMLGISNTPVVSTESSGTTSTETVKETVNENQDIEDYILNLTELTPKAEELYTKLSEVFQKRIQKYLVKINNWMGQQNEIVLDIDNSAKICLLIQTINHQKNANRREAIQRNEYISPFSSTQEERTNYLRKIVLEHVQNKRNGLYANFISEMNSCSVARVASLFASTSDIYEAAGMIFGRKRGQGDAMAFSRALYSPNIPLFKEKVKMLLEGEFQGIALFTDSVTNHTWVPARHHIFRLWFNHENDMTTQEWVDLSGRPEAYFLSIHHFHKVLNKNDNVHL